jgi:hypothetical protein
MRQRIRVETGTRAPQASGGTAWSSSSNVTLWCDAITITAAARERYQSLDRVVEYEFRFRDRPTITMQGTRFVWLTNGHPNRLKIYIPAAPPTQADGVGRYTNILVEDTGEVVSS